MWPDWEVEQDRLEAAGLWQKVWVSISKVTKYHEVMKLLSLTLFQLGRDTFITVTVYHVTQSSWNRVNEVPP